VGIKLRGAWRHVAVAVPRPRDPYIAVPDSTNSASGRTGERFSMKKPSGNAAASTRSLKTRSDSFIDELQEFQQLQKRLGLMVNELESTISQLKQNLQKAHRSARAQSKTRRRRKSK
jgi:predicted RNase H-like nuclease (RuvC/YqgF family)